MENLWSKENTKNLLSEVKQILLQQADYLGKLTNNKITATIETKVAAYQAEPDMKFFNHHFVINAPALKYNFVLFYVHQQFNSEFPLNIIVSENKLLNASDIKNKQEFSQRLKLIFADKKTTELINSLLAQC